MREFAQQNKSIQQNIRYHHAAWHVSSASNHWLYTRVHPSTELEANATHHISKPIDQSINHVYVQSLWYKLLLVVVSIPFARTRQWYLNRLRLQGK
jgi:hypothetical protein